ncbi:MAG: hypothetical protein IJR45_07435 [Firmicutes bacterium]|nr:hypothetical protein [Bacillota bacterium]
MYKTFLNSSETSALRNQAGVSHVRRSRKIRAFFAMIFAVTLCGSLPSFIGEKPIFESCITAEAATNNVTYSDGILTLNGEVTKEQKLTYKSEAVTKVTASQGTILPVDCSELFYMPHFI